MSVFFIGIDSGTQGTKAILIDGTGGKVVAQASACYGLSRDLPDGTKEQDPRLWVEALEKTVRDILRTSKVNPSRIKGIGISGQQHGLVALDAQGKVLRPAKLWCDTSTQPQSATLLKRLGGLKKTIALGGNGLPTGFTAPKILWLRQNEPQIYKRLATVLLPHDYLNFHLTGRATMEAGDASGTGLFDTRTRNWHPRLVAALDPHLASTLPAIQDSSQPAGHLTLFTAKRLGLDPGTLVSAGGGDNMMGAIGTGNTKPGIVTASLGTSGTLYTYSSRPVIDPRGEIAAFCDSTGGWLPLVCTMNVTVATELVKKAFDWGNEDLTRQAAAVPPGSDGLLLLPYFNGERTPDLPRAKGVYAGLDTHNFTRGHLARAAMEGVAFGLNYGLNRMRDLGLRAKEIRLTGGGSQNPLWRQILADVFDAEVVCLAASEGAAFGAALQAKWCHALTHGQRLRLPQITDAMVKLDKTTRAKPGKAAKLYRLLQQRHTAFSQHLAPYWQ
jgi:xylulokinase